MSERAVTISCPKCDTCPPLAMWPAKNLIFNSCPECTDAADPVKTARALRAKRLVSLPVVEEGKL